MLRTSNVKVKSLFFGHLRKSENKCPFSKLTNFRNVGKKKITNFRKNLLHVKPLKIQWFKSSNTYLSQTVRSSEDHLIQAGFYLVILWFRLSSEGLWSAGLVCLSSTFLLFSWDQLPGRAHLYHGDSRSARNGGILQASYCIMCAEISLICKLNGQVRAQGWVRNSTYPESHSKAAWQRNPQEEMRNLGHYWNLASHL